MAKKAKKTTQSKKIFGKISVVAVCLTAVILLFVVGAHQYIQSFYDSSLHGEEILEQKQNTIPADVLQRIEKEDILGASTSARKKIISVRVPILMYHYVEYVQDKGDKTRIGLDITPFTLDEEIKTLRDAGYTFMTNKELTDVIDDKAPLPQKPVLLTFDDGYRDFYTDAYPILKKYNAKATQYVITGFLDQPNHLLISQLQEIASNGLVEIGAHTVHHVWLKGSPEKTVTQEVSESKKTLEDLIHMPVVSFAYPFGAFDNQAIDAVRKAGFTSAVSTVPGIEQTTAKRYLLYRIRPGGKVGQALLDCLNNAEVCYNLKSGE